jgi:hypothetical protein
MATNKPTEEERLAGSVAKIPTISVGVSFLAAVGVAILTLMFYRGSKDTRDTLNFFVLAGALAGGVVSAFYLWAGVKTTIAQRHAAAAEQKIQFALQFLTRWNDPDMGKLRREWRELMAEIEAAPKGIVVLIEHDMPKRTIVADVLNFFEEMGYAARSDAADLATLRQSFHYLSLTYFRLTRPWIEFRRSPVGAGTAWSNFEWLCDQWKNS